MRKLKNNRFLLPVLLLILSLLCGCKPRAATPVAMPPQPSVTVTAADDGVPPINNTDLYSYEGEDPKTLYQYYKENEDTIGWLTIAGINTDNIVMLGQKYKEYEKGDMGKNHYLNYDFYHNGRTAGELYIDHRGAIGYDTFSQNVTLYGHHMQNGTMLAGLERYRNRSHLEEYPYFTFRSLWNTYHFKIFAVFVVDQKNPVDFAFDFRQPEYESEQAFLDLVDQIKERSMHDIDVEVGGSDRVMNLITCTYPTGNPDTDDARLVVFGRLCTDQKEIDEAEALLKTKS